MNQIINENTAAPAKVGDLWYDPSKRWCQFAVMHEGGVKYYLTIKDAAKVWERINGKPYPKKIK